MLGIRGARVKWCSPIATSEWPSMDPAGRHTAERFGALATGSGEGDGGGVGDAA